MADGSLYQETFQFQTRERSVEYHLLTSEYMRRCGDNTMALFYCPCKALLRALLVSWSALWQYVRDVNGLQMVGS